MKDWIIIKEGGCKRIDLSLIDYFEQAGNAQCRAYTYALSEVIPFAGPLSKTLIPLNLKIDWDLLCSGGTGILEWWPCGAVWIGLGGPDTYGDIKRGTWLWHDIDPYMVLSASPDFTIHHERGPDYGAMIGSERVKWCAPNLLTHFGILSMPANFKIKYLHVHSRTNASLYFGGNGMGSRIKNIRLCKGRIGPDWCEK